MHHRFFVDGPLLSQESIDLKGDELHHATRVVRLREGEEVELFDGRGNAVSGRLVILTRDRATVQITGAAPSREPAIRITLAMSIIQLEKFELVLQKAVELGASAILPMRTDRCEVREERYRGKGERWRKILLEAAKQSGRSVVPELLPELSFDEVAGSSGEKIVFDAEADPSPSSSLGGAVRVLIGPEGGWSPREQALAAEMGCRFERLGPRRLRAETAAMAAIVLITARAGDI
ncbi:MAG TPA: 16S rRNA (uracil(1498)-N(3))-methyltransferase [Thermoanaerobaculia bacterium]|nr:16S rRNA (uracil(1498)-N(3))-methyltransferase [Thermoanaerobaculia bacterium]